MVLKFNILHLPARPITYFKILLIIFKNSSMDIKKGSSSPQFKILLSIIRTSVRWLSPIASFQRTQIKPSFFKQLFMKHSDKSFVGLRKSTFASLLSVHNAVSLLRHEQMCLSFMGLLISPLSLIITKTITSLVHLPRRLLLFLKWFFSTK